MNDNYNIDDFFKNKLNSTEGNETWDKPSEKAWINAQSSVLQGKKSRMPISTMSMATLFLSAGLLASLIYIFNLTNNITDLDAQLQVAQQQLLTQKKATQSLEKSCNTNQQAQKNSINKANSRIVAFENDLRNYKSIIQKQHLHIDDLTTQNSFLQNTLTQKELKPIAKLEHLKPKNKTNKSKIFSKEELNKAKKVAIDKLIASEPPFQQLTFNSITRLKSSSYSKPTTPILILPTAPKSYQKFEIGVDYSVLNIQTPMNYNFENTDDFQISRTITNKINHRLGFHIGYAPVKNFFLKTGIRQTQFASQKTTKLGFIYNKSTDYVNPRGELSNDFILNNTTHFSEVTQKITAQIPHNLANGDMMFATIDAQQDFELTQIPVGFAWYRGKGSWQWEFQMGMTWNNIQVKNSAFDVHLQANHQNIPVQNISTISSTAASNAYLGSYMGYGTSYKWNKNLQLNAGFTLENNLPNFSFQNLSSLNLSNLAWNLSANYRF